MPKSRIISQKLISKDVFKQPYRSSGTFGKQFSTPTEKEANYIVNKPESEMAKPYRAPRYEEMEYDFIEPWDLGGYDPLSFFDLPFDRPQLTPETYDYDPLGTQTNLLFRCLGNFCFCEGEEKCFNAQCNHEILDVRFSNKADAGKGVSITFTKERICFTVPDGVDSDWLSISIDILMRVKASSRPVRYKVGGHYDILVTQCTGSDCDACADCLTETPVIGYTSQQMDNDGGNDQQTLTVTDYGSIPASCFTWEISGQGYFTGGVAEGYSVEYNTDTDQNDSTCSANPTITLKCDGVQVDTLDIAINSYTSATVATAVNIEHFSQRDFGAPANKCTTDMSPNQYHCTYSNAYLCDGTVWNSGATYEGFVCRGLPYETAPRLIVYNTGGGYMTECSGTTTDANLSACLTAFLSSYGYTDGGYYGWRDLRTAPMISGGCCSQQML